MRLHRSPAALAVLSGLVMVAASACGSGSSSGTGSRTPVSGETFTMALPSDPGNLDPSLTPSSVARTMLSLAYDPLVYVKPDGSIVSGLAEKWSSTATTATFTLRSGISCQDGSTLSASDVADNISYIGNPENQSPLLDVFVHQGTTVSADDAARTVTVTSPSANGFLLTELSGVLMICRKGLDDHSSLASATNGTGPWQLDQAVANDHYRFNPHRGYAWGPDGTDLSAKGTPAAVNVRIVPSVTTTANLLTSGEINMGGVTGPDTKRLDAMKLPTIDAVDTTGETWFNQSDGHPAQSLAVRKALTLAIDRDAVGKIATGNKAVDSTSFITLEPNPCAGSDPVKGNLPDTSMSEAAEALTADGWAKGSDGIWAKDGKPLSISFRYDAQGSTSRSAGVEYLAAQWKKLGVDVNTKALPESQLNQLFFSTGEWDVAWADFTFNIPSQMVAFVSGDGPPDGANFPHIDNADYDAAVAKATPLVGTAGCADWADAEKALLAQFNLIPMFDSTNHTYLRKASVTAPGGSIWGTTLRLYSA